MVNNIIINSENERLIILIPVTESTKSYLVANGVDPSTLVVVEETPDPGEPFTPLPDRRPPRYFNNEFYSFYGDTTPEQNTNGIVFELHYFNNIFFNFY